MKIAKVIEMENKIYDLVGIGLGVFNLSLAAQLDENQCENVLFLDKQKEVTWHGGLLLESSELQVSFLKDLVTPVDPQSRYTFLNYLNSRNILYQFLNRKTPSISRNQFQQYFRWVANQLTNIRFNTEVLEVKYDGELFTIVSTEDSYQARNIVLGTGIKGKIPSCAKTYQGDDVFHVNRYTQYRSSLAGKRVAVVGSGQSSAEVVKDIMDTHENCNIHWYGRRLCFSQLEDNCFVNEFYVPSFVSKFRSMDEEKKHRFIDKFSMSSDGINQDLLDSLYRLMFERKYFSDSESAYDVQPGQDLVDITKTDAGYELVFKSWFSNKVTNIEVDKVILATGFESGNQSIINHLLGDDSSPEQALCVNEQFELKWQHQSTNKIYIQNGSKSCIGLADPNLSIAAWRAGMISNNILGYERYASSTDLPLLNVS